MTRNPRYDILFEPVRIGPVTAKNRFFQVPHASGTGCGMPETRAALREAKAEGGWGVVCTGYCSIHPSSDDWPLPYCSLWNEADVKAQAVMVEAVHRHGALAGVELWHGGALVPNRMTRERPLSPSGHWDRVWGRYPSQSRAADDCDIRNIRRWHREAALRAKQAGFDIVYIYAGMGYLPFQFILERYNRRGDAYGGSFENRARLLKELIEEVKDAVGERCAVAVRLTAEELLGDRGFRGEVEGRALLEHLGELPDLWDVKMGFFNDSRPSRFSEEAFQEDHVRYVKALTSKPVVGVGRFTSPDTMVRQIRQGVLDLIGAARPSIADPFLPRKIDEGREDEIRECIGCNVCIASYAEGVPIRCTQNPTMGEEWRKGWHPERVPARGSDDRVLVVGAGPAGLECAMTLGKRGYEVTLAEASKELGGRVAREANLPGLAAWGRVRDYRVGQIERLANVAVYLDSELTADDVLAFGAERVVLATGAAWSPEWYDHIIGLPTAAPEGAAAAFTPDDIFAGAEFPGPVLIYDFDPYYMGGCLAELLRQRSQTVHLATPDTLVSPWAGFTNEQPQIHARLLHLGIGLERERVLSAFDGTRAALACVHNGRDKEIACRSLVVVGARTPRDGLYGALLARSAVWPDQGVKSVERIGDCLAPGAIVHAVYDGHRYGEALDRATRPERAERREHAFRDLAAPATELGAP
jgi:dimethylamine/trimethylamine dehydrogenase